MQQWTGVSCPQRAVTAANTPATTSHRPMLAGKQPCSLGGHSCLCPLTTSPPLHALGGFTCCFTTLLCRQGMLLNYMPCRLHESFTPRVPWRCRPWHLQENQQTSTAQKQLSGRHLQHAPLLTCAGMPLAGRRCRSRQLQRNPGGCLLLCPRSAQSPQVPRQPGPGLSPKHEDARIDAAHAVAIAGFGALACDSDFCPGAAAG